MLLKFWVVVVRHDTQDILVLETRNAVEHKVSWGLYTGILKQNKYENINVLFGEVEQRMSEHIQMPKTYGRLLDFNEEHKAFVLLNIVPGPFMIIPNEKFVDGMYADISRINKLNQTPELSLIISQYPDLNFLNVRTIH